MIPKPRPKLPPLITLHKSPLSIPTNTTTTTTTNFLSHHPVLPLLEKAKKINHQKHQHFIYLLHAHTITSDLISDPFAASRIIQFFLQTKPINLQYATTIFNSLKKPDIYTWNLMIASHIDSGLPVSSIGFYFRMRSNGAPPNDHTFALLVKSCMGNNIGLGKLVHGQVLKCGMDEFIVVKNSLLRMYCTLGRLQEARELFDRSFSVDLVSWNTLISAYGKNGDVVIARNMFERMPERNLVSWSALIDGYVRSGEFLEALRMWRKFQDTRLDPDDVLLVSVLKACGQLNALDEGRMIHGYVGWRYPECKGNVVLGTALIDMYCKCGCIDEANKVFDRVENVDVVLWNAMIGGLAMHGYSQQALDLFRKMKMKHPKVVPNRSTYISVLCACTHAGMVDEGIKIFESMKKLGVEPRSDHYGCIADLLGRSGRLKEAEEVLLTMPMEPQAAQWGALMSACRMHRDVEVGERIGRRLIEMEPFDGGRYILLANLYTDAGQWAKAKDLRSEMNLMGAKKEGGHSFI